MSRYIDIEPYEKDGWYLQRRYRNSSGESIVTTPLFSVPTAEVEPVKHGRWICINGWVECSVCHQEPPNESNIESDYCPNCGAKMNEVENG